MSLDAALKIGIGLLGAAAVSIGGYEIHSRFVNTLERKYSLMDENDSHWDWLVTAYESEDKSTQTPRRMKNFSFSSTGSNSFESKKAELINHCKFLLKTSLREKQEVIDEIEEDIKSWCIKRTTD